LSEIIDTSGVDVSAQQAQRKHFDWYAGNEDQTYNAYQNSPFWVAFDAAIFSEWKSRIRPGGIMLDVGCADGRSCFSFLNRGTTIVGFDISRSLVRQAIERAAAAGAQASTTFFVGDASALPFRDNTFDHVVIYGVLHHVPDPAATCREAHRVLKPGGVYFGSENNVTVFRGIFDLLMKLRPMWKEAAGEQPLISTRHIQQWLQGLPVSMTARSSVFVPPQLVNLLGHKSAPAVLSISDSLFKAVPGLQNQGGLIVFEVTKQPGGTASVAA
jgi:ubiquinone/menaquinone biosynthesis C-methylase UbiE